MNDEQGNATEENSAPPVPPLKQARGKDRIRQEYQPMERPMGVLTVAETLLRRPGQIVYAMRQGPNGSLAGTMLLLAAICLLAYGVTVGFFSMGAQLWAAPLKITAGMLLSALICLPSLVVFSCLAGSETSMSEIGTLLIAAVSVTALLLLGFAPVSWIFSQSTEAISFMGFLQVVFWSIGMFYGLRFLFAALGFLDGRGVQHLVVWSVIFVLVCLQMTTTLRPVLGSSERFLQPEKKFFLTHWAECVGDE